MHLLTHGFFKAGLFLGAGSVMHAMNDEVNMRRYGGLRTVLPITFATFGLGYLAIIGVPPLAGFFSKDGIIEAALGAGGAKGIILGGAAILGAGITAFYMTRVMLMTFFGEKRWASRRAKRRGTQRRSSARVTRGDDLADDPVGRRLGGVRRVLRDRRHAGALARTRRRRARGRARDARRGSSRLVVLAVVAAGIAIAYRMYGTRAVPEEVPAGSALTVAARQDLYGDAFNERVFMRPGQLLTEGLVEIDDDAVDGAANGLAALVGRISNGFRQLQTGFARSYALSMLAGAALLVAAILAVQLW